MKAKLMLLHQTEEEKEGRAVVRSMLEYLNYIYNIYHR
jgi:hypothetical protein